MGALSGVEVTPGPGNQSLKRAARAAAGVRVGGHGGCSRRWADEAEGLPVPTWGPVQQQHQAAGGRPFSPGDQRLHLGRSHLQGRRRVLRGVRLAGLKMPQQQGEDLFPGSFPPLSRLAREAPFACEHPSTTSLLSTRYPGPQRAQDGA